MEYVDAADGSAVVSSTAITVVNYCAQPRRSTPIAAMDAMATNIKNSSAYTQGGTHRAVPSQTMTG